MAIEKISAQHTHAANAAADLSEKLNYFAKIDTSGLIALADDGGAITGVITEAAALGKPATIAFGAILKVVCAETITPGALLASDADGKAVAAAVGDATAGIAINEAAVAAGGLVSFIAAPGRRHA